MRLLSGFSGTGSGSVVTTREQDRRDPRLCQVHIDSTGSVDIEGRLAPDLPWVVIDTFNSGGDTSRQINLYPQMRATVTANGATISVDIDAVDLTP